MTVRRLLSGRWAIDEEKVASAVRLDERPLRMLLWQLPIPVGTAGFAAWSAAISAEAWQTAFLAAFALFSAVPAVGMASVMREEGVL